VSDTYRYDAFGAVRSSSGASTQPFRYTGEQNDANGLEYLRARYYDPAIGRFITQDPIGSLNRYAYVLNNPLLWVDPWGLRNLEGTPTPTPVGMVQVCVWVSPEGCEELGPWVEIPRGGDDWALFPWIKEHVVAPVLNALSSECSQGLAKIGIGIGSLALAATGVGALAEAGGITVVSASSAAASAAAAGAAAGPENIQRVISFLPGGMVQVARSCP
jgi:RHS repeat-associated protein